MIFWILLAVAVVVVGYVFTVDYILPKVKYHQGSNKYGTKYGNYAYDYAELETTGIAAFFSVIILGFATLVLLPLSFLFQTGGVLVEEDKVNLQALATKEQTEGRVVGSIFLTSGYVQSEPVFSYISEDEGAFRSEWADADQSVVYQDETDQPYVWEREYKFYSAWLVPWAIGQEPRYEFHVPEGSISNEIFIAP